MPQCSIHPDTYYTPGRTCQKCSDQNYEEWKTSIRAGKDKEKKYAKAIKRRISPNHDREKLKANLQYNWRAKIFPFYQKKGLTSFCWIDRKPFLKGVTNRLYTAQVSHYYAKSHIYQLWTHPVNSGICCYRHNVDKPETVAAMEPMMIEVWGQQRFDDMKGEAAIYLEWINKGIDDEGHLVRRNPSDQWFIDEIAKTKKMVIS